MVQSVALVFEPLEALHDQYSCFQHTIQAAVMAVEAIHAVGVQRKTSVPAGRRNTCLLATRRSPPTDIQDEMQPPWLWWWCTSQRSLLATALVDQPLARDAIDELGIVQLARGLVLQPLALLGPGFSALQHHSQL